MLMARMVMIMASVVVVVIVPIIIVLVRMRCTGITIRLRSHFRHFEERYPWWATTFNNVNQVPTERGLDGLGHASGFEVERRLQEDLIEAVAFGDETEITAEEARRGVLGVGASRLRKRPTSRTVLDDFFSYAVRLRLAPHKDVLDPNLLRAQHTRRAEYCQTDHRSKELTICDSHWKDPFKKTPSRQLGSTQIVAAVVGTWVGPAVSGYETRVNTNQTGIIANPSALSTYDKRPDLDGGAVESSVPQHLPES